MVTRRPPPQPNQAKGKQRLTTDEAAKLTKLQKGTVYVYVRKQIIPYHKSKHELWFDRDELLEWMNVRTQEISLSVEDALKNYRQYFNWKQRRQQP